jgi:hypothetical protein
LEITKRELEQAFAEYGDKFGGRLEDYFALLYLEKEFARSANDIYQQVAFGGNDYGIDAFYVDVNRRNLYLYQFKWSEDHRLFQASFERLISKGMDRVFGNPLQDPSQNQLLLQIKSALNENKAVIDHVLVRFVFNGDPAVAEQSAVLDSLREDLESKKYLIDNHFGRQVELTFQFLSNKTKKLAGLAHTKKTYQYHINLGDTIACRTQNGEEMRIGFIPLMDLYGMYREMGTRFFERNIRAGLSPDKPPNRAMRRALANIVVEEREPPDIFAFNHNGITLAAERLEPDRDGLLVVEPRLLNGAQTLTSLAKFLKDNEGNPALDKNEQMLKSIQVLAKIIWNAPNYFVTNVTVCNNKQNPVSPWNLRANDHIQLQLQDKFASDLQVYYERQQEAFENMTDEDLERVGVDPTQGRPIQITRLAQTFLAVQGEIDKMSRMPDVFENEKTYHSTFRESYLHSDSKKIMLSYKIQFRLNRIIWAIMEKGQNKYFYISKARNLVWALLIQGILNDFDLSNLCERFGAQIVMEADFTEYLKKIASTRVRFIINEAVKDARSQNLISEEKYSFLRTKAVYYRCMDIAHKKYRWKKKSF